MATHKEELYKELEFKTKVSVEGIKIDPKILFYLSSKAIKNSQIYELFLRNFFIQSNFLTIFKEKKIIETIENFFMITDNEY